MKKVLLLLLVLLQLSVAYAGPDRVVVNRFLDDLEELGVEELPGLLSFYYMENPEIFLAIDRCSIVAKSDLVNYIFNFNQGTDGAYALGFTAVTPNQLQPALESYFQDTNYYRCSIERSLPYVFEETLFYQGVDSGYTIMFDVAWDD